MSVSRFHFQYALADQSPVRHHPQRAAQLLAGAILDALRSIDPRSRVACELQSDSAGVTLRGHVSAAVGESQEGDVLHNLDEVEPDYVI